MHARRSGMNGVTVSALSEASSSGERVVLNPEAFRRMIALERKRSERSRKPFILLLLDMGDRPSEKSGKILGKISSVLSATTRDTDVTGWYANDCVLGVMFTEIAAEDSASIPGTVIARVTDTLRSNLALEQFNRVRLSFHVFPEDWDHDDHQGSSNPTLYPDLSQREDGRKLFRVHEAHHGCGRQRAGAAVFLARFSGDCRRRQSHFQRGRFSSGNGASASMENRLSS